MAGSANLKRAGAERECGQLFHATIFDKAHAHATAVPASGLDRDGRALIAIGNGVFHDVVEHASHLDRKSVV